jgi:hypothetical protein
MTILLLTDFGTEHGCCDGALTRHRSSVLLINLDNRKEACGPCSNRISPSNNCRPRYSMASSSSTQRTNIWAAAWACSLVCARSIACNTSSRWSTPGRNSCSRAKPMASSRSRMIRPSRRCSSGVKWKSGLMQSGTASEAKGSECPAVWPAKTTEQPLS